MDLEKLKDLAASRFVIGFTGHRDKISKTQDILNSVDSCWSLCHVDPRKPALFLNGGAKGFDQQVTSIVGIAFKHNFPDSVTEEIFSEYDKYPENQKWLALLDRNKVIINLSHVLIACWDGRTKGGTYKAVLYALSVKRIRVVVINPDR